MKELLKNKSVILSVIILNYNSAKYLKQCLQSILLSKTKYLFEVISVDNASTDTDFIDVKNFILNHPLASRNKFKFINLNTNRGFSAGNNQGIKYIFTNSRYVLFLNPDTVVATNTFEKLINFFQKNNHVDAATCKIKLASTNKMQPECHRGFPTPWRSFCHFTGLSKLFPKSRLFSGYFLGHLDILKTHRIESCVGAFFMIKKNVGQKLNWWNEKYFFYGDDLDFCYRLYKNNYSLYFYPHCQITHYQGISSGIISNTKNISSASRSTKIKIAKSSTQAMRIFYQDNLFNQYSPITKLLVTSGINLLESIRVFKATYL